MPLPRRHLLSNRQSCGFPWSGSVEKHDGAGNQAFLADSAKQVSKITAVEAVCRVRGGSQAHLVRCSDGGYYVVKFQNNPQGCRILANELLGSFLALHLGLPVPQIAIVEVSDALIRDTEDLVIELRHGRTPCRAGLCFGCRYPDVFDGKTVVDLLPRAELLCTRNVQDFAGMLVFDKWTSNTDGRQAVFTREPGAASFHATMIDQGNCFDGEAWAFRDAPLYGLYQDPSVYTGCRNLDSFEPWLSRLEKETNRELLASAGDVIPSEWYGADTIALQRLLDVLNVRRSRVRELLRSTFDAYPQAFPRLNQSMLDKPSMARRMAAGA